MKRASRWIGRRPRPIPPPDAEYLYLEPHFNRAFYLSAYPDVRRAGADPLQHYLDHGWREGRDPTATFSTRRFLEQHGDDGSAASPLSRFLWGGLSLAQRGMVKPPFDASRMRAEQPDLDDDDLWALTPKVYDFTECSLSTLFNLYSSLRYILRHGVAGDLVECGVHMGGAVMLMEHILLRWAPGSARRIFALDTFSGPVRRDADLDIEIGTGLPTGIVDDGEGDPDYTAQSFMNMRSVGFRNLRVLKGDVLDTIPALDVDRIAILRLDTDTHDTTKFELENLYDRVVEGGVVIIDDYGYTLGCKKAVDDFIADKPILLQRINPTCRCWVKPPQRRRWLW